MKTYEEFIDEVVAEEYKRINPVAMNIHKNAAKKYAKQWVEEAQHIIGRGDSDPAQKICDLLYQIDAQ